MGASGADAFLCHLSRSITAALECLAASATAARTKLETMREASRVEDHALCDELEARFSAAESTKVVALERELCAVDGVLESMRAERCAVGEAATSLSDADLVAQHSELMARLDAVDTLLLALPTSVVEPPHLDLVIDEPSMRAGVAIMGRIIAPRAITAADLTLGSAPPFARADSTLQLSLHFQTASLSSQYTGELEVSLGAAAAATHVAAWLEAPGAAVIPLRTAVSVDSPGRRVAIAVVIPNAIAAESWVRVGSVTISGQPVSSGALSIPLRRDMRTPLRLHWISQFDSPSSVCISTAGQLFIPQSGSSGVLAFDADGAPLPDLPVAGIRLSRETCWTAFAGGAQPSLLLADAIGASSRLVAIDPTSRAVRWATVPGVFRGFRGCEGLAALPDSGTVAVASTKALFAHRLSDGERVGSLSVPRLHGTLAADSTAGAIFGNVAADGGKFAIGRFSWAPGSGLRAEGIVAVAGVGKFLRPLTVVPPSPGKRASHLVIGATNKPELLVLVLPGLTLTHVHVLDGMRVLGLASDPWGGTLAVCDGPSKAVHILAWPLRGMPVLD